jgi:HAD superfamily hydrolase (TIGR01509 family)
MGKRPRMRAVLLDWDGTVLDTFDAQVRATKAVFLAFGVTWSEARFMAYPTDWRRHYLDAGLADEVLGDASALYREAYAEQATRLRPYARQTLHDLSRSGLRLALVTSGARARVMRELSRYQLDTAFALVVTYDDVARTKPSPEAFELAMRRLRVNSDQAIAVGDTAVDEQAAQAAGIPHLLIRSRYTQPPVPQDAVSGWRTLARQLHARCEIDAR